MFTNYGMEHGIRVHSASNKFQGKNMADAFGSELLIVRSSAGGRRSLLDCDI